MLHLTIRPQEFWDDEKEEFLTRGGGTIQLEHSLVSISKWESKWKIPFFSDRSKTEEELLDYVRCMTITQNVRPNLFEEIGQVELSTINSYIDDSMTATWFSEINPVEKPGKKEVVTSEIIYFWMFSFGIPKECEKWHINRLITLIRVFNVKNQKPRKMSRKEAYQQHKSLNAARRNRLKSKG